MKFKLAAAGALAGAVNGLFGAGGGMLLVPLLSAVPDVKEEEIFPSSIAVILPVCLVSLFLSCSIQTLPWTQALPYLLGSAAGGILAGVFGPRFPTLWLHRLLGLLILWGGIRHLC